MAFPDHLLTLATLRLLTLTPLAATYTPSTSTAVASSSSSSTPLHPQDRFHAVRSRPLRILAELTAAYLQLLGNAARNHAEQAGRTAANALDAREAIADYGGSVQEIDDWARECQLDRGILSSNDAMLNDAAGERADAADLGALLKDTSYNPAYHPPIQVIEYAPLTDREAAIVDALQHNQSLLPFLPYSLQQRVQQDQEDTASSSGSSDEEHQAPSPSSSRGASLPPPSYEEATSSALSLRKREKLRAHDDDYNKENDDPLSFLPPFPDLDATHASLQTIIEDESGRIVKRARRALDANVNMANLSQARKNASIAWLRAVPYETSSLAEYEGGKFSVPSMKDDALKKGIRHGESMEGDDEEEDAFTSSSLPYFLETFNWVALDYEQQGDQALLPLRHNTKRKRAATAIHSNILNPSDDSLSGSIPALPPRHAKKQAGWIPYPLINPDISDPSEPGGKAIRPFPFQLHPFSTQLPNSITESIPQLVLPHSMKVLAPPMHPRYSTSSTSIRTLLESSSPALFSRTTRMGPPGPLLENGAAGFYQIEQEKPIIPGWPGDAMPRMMGWNFDWEIGNELEDGIKERKNAGIVDMAIHSESSNTTSTLANGQSDRDANNNSKTFSTTGEGTKEEYAGPTFPALPIRPAYDAHQAKQQREQERREEEAEFQFQEVQEDKETESLALQAKKKEEEEEAEKERQRVFEVEQSKLVAEQQTVEGEKLQAKELADKKAREDAAERVALEKPKPLPKFSFSLKLGGSSLTSNSAPIPSASAGSAPSAAVLPSNATISQALSVSVGDAAGQGTSQTPPVGNGIATAAQAAELQQDTAHGTQETEGTGESRATLSQDPIEAEGVPTGEVLLYAPSNTMWTPGSAVEQDYRALAADISSLSQPPIVLPDPSTPSHIEPVAPPTPVKSPTAPHQPVVTPAEEAEDVEGDADGEEDAENESEDDLFDEVEVDNAAADSSMNAGITEAFPAPPPVVGDGSMHVEVEEMNM